MSAYSEFLVDLTRLLTGDEGLPTDLPLNTLKQIIALAEGRIYSQVRSRYNEKDFADAIIDGAATPCVVTDNLAPIPDDFESASIAHFGGSPLLPVPEAFVLEYNAAGNTGRERYFAEAGPNFTFAPAVADATALQGRYFCRLPALDAASAPDNALFTNEREVFLYACLAEGAPIFGKFSELAVWEAKYNDVKDHANKRRESAAYSGGRMRAQPSTRLMR
jgi:hypothetical protein